MPMINARRQMQDEILLNLLSAHKKMAEHIDQKNFVGFIKFTKFVLGQIDELGNYAAEFFSEHERQGE